MFCIANHFFSVAFFRQNFTFAAAPFSVSSSRQKVVDFSFPLFEDANAILLHLPKSKDNLWQVFKPLTPSVWLSVFGAMFFVALLSWLFSRGSPFSAWNLCLPFAIKDEVQIEGHLWNAMGALLQQGKFCVGLSQSMVSSSFVSFYPTCMGARY